LGKEKGFGKHKEVSGRVWENDEHRSKKIEEVELGRGKEF